jgi:hypothetical protein
VTIYCPACESPGARRTDLGYIADDGTTGSVAGIACAACGYIAQDVGAPYIPDGTRVDLRGMTALEWMLTGLRAAGCDPRPRP